MRLRVIFLAFLLAGVAPASRTADAISIKIRQVGLENFYSANGSPTLVSFDARNNTTQAVPISLLVDEVNLQNDAASVTTSITLPLVLSPGEERTFRVPLQITTRNEGKLVIYLEARDSSNLIVGRTARLVASKTDGQVIALICATPDLCRNIRQSILLSGSPDEQTYKSQSLRMLQLSDPPSEGWAYAPANTVILAAPIAHLSADQRDALELFARSGGTLVLIEDQIAGGISSKPGRNLPAGSPPPIGLSPVSGIATLLETYRAQLPFGHPVPVGSGRLIRLPSAAGREFSDYFRPMGFSASTPEETRRQFARNIPFLPAADSSQSAWLMKRLGTAFRFPTFFEIFLWMIGYLLAVGIFNFIILRRMGRPELGWFTIPAIAILTSVLLYGASARNRPRNFSLDDMVVYRMDDLSPLATADAKVRISSPRRSIVEPVLPAEWIYSPLRNFARTFDRPRRPVLNGSANVNAFALGKTWETTLTLRKWSFTELDFTGSHRFAGTISRDATNRIRNGTGITFRQAIFVDHNSVFLLGSFPAGESVDLANTPRREYQKESSRLMDQLLDYPGPPFPFRKPPAVSSESYTAAEARQMKEEWHNLPKQPFSLLEFLRGWPASGDDVFVETKAVFFGLSDQATLGPSLQGQSPDRKSAALVIVTFGAWP
jgi:hypothetical protein